jgi:hypothetical protein
LFAYWLVVGLSKLAYRKLSGKPKPGNQRP